MAQESLLQQVASLRAALDQSKVDQSALVQKLNAVAQAPPSAPASVDVSGEV